MTPTPNFTLDYYNKNARKYFDRTIKIDYQRSYDPFLAFIPPAGSILDVGCGAGRDSKYFLEQGFSVTSLDASEELVKIASSYTGQPVRHMTFNEINFTNTFDGVWAVASLLHVPSNEIGNIFQKIAQALKPGGIFYASFRWGDFEGITEERYFNYMHEEKLEKCIALIPDLTLLAMDKRASYEENNSQPWLHCLIKKT